MSLKIIGRSIAAMKISLLWPEYRKSLQNMLQIDSHRNDDYGNTKILDFIKSIPIEFFIQIKRFGKKQGNFGKYSYEFKDNSLMIKYDPYYDKKQSLNTDQMIVSLEIIPQTSRNNDFIGNATLFNRNGETFEEIIITFYTDSFEVSNPNIKIGGR